MLSLIGLATVYFLIGSLITWVQGKEEPDMGYKSLMWGPVAWRKVRSIASTYLNRYKNDDQEPSAE